MQSRQNPSAFYDIEQRASHSPNLKKESVDLAEAPKSLYLIVADACSNNSARCNFFILSSDSTKSRIQISFSPEAELITSFAFMRSVFFYNWQSNYPVTLFQ